MLRTMAMSDAKLWYGIIRSNGIPSINEKNELLLLAVRKANRIAKAATFPDESRSGDRKLLVYPAKTNPKRGRDKRICPKVNVHADLKPGTNGTHFGRTGI